MSKQTGFTLIELMIVIAVVAILSVIAIPAYQQSAAKAKRGDAQGALYGLANALERYYTENYKYSGTTAGAIYHDQVPVDGGTKYYDLSISAPTSAAYIISATRTGSMAGDKCGDFTLTQTNTQSITNQDVGVTASDCWR